MAKYTYSDDTYIYIGSEYAEAYIPDDLFDGVAEDPTASSVAYVSVGSLFTIGIFYMRFFNSEEQPRDKVPIVTANYPNIIESRPSGETTKETLTINGKSTKFRVFRYYKGDIFCEKGCRKAGANVELFTNMMLRGHIPSSLSYEDIYHAWRKCFAINGISSKIPPVLMQAMVAKMCRNKKNIKQEFRYVAGKGSSDPYGYESVGINTISAYTSALSSMIFERFGEKLTTSIIMTKEGTDQERSPIEDVITM